MTKPAPHSPPSAVRPPGNNELVLVADDEEAIRIVSRRTLESYGYRVLLASNGPSAIEHLQAKPNEIDVFLTDMSMPGMDGPATIDAMTRIRPDLKVIAMSGYSVKDQPGGGDLPAQVRAIIDKPYTPEILLQTLRRVLDSQP